MYNIAQDIENEFAKQFKSLKTLNHKGKSMKVMEVTGVTLQPANDNEGTREFIVNVKAQAEDGMGGFQESNYECRCNSKIEVFVNIGDINVAYITK